MVAPYENAADANQHLHHTVIMYDDRPVWVEDVFSNDRNDILCTLNFLPRVRDPFSVSVFDPKLDARGMGQRLGYMNYFNQNGVVFLSRIPSRQYKQGLSRGNVAATYDSQGRRTFDFSLYSRRPEFVDMLTGTYPTFEEACRRLEAEPNIAAIAFHREFALQRDELGYYLLLFKGTKVAWGDPKSFKLPSHFIYLKEVLQKNGVPYEA